MTGLYRYDIMDGMSPGKAALPDIAVFSDTPEDALSGMRFVIEIIDMRDDGSKTDAVESAFERLDYLRSSLSHSVRLSELSLVPVYNIFGRICEVIKKIQFTASFSGMSYRGALKFITALENAVSRTEEKIKYTISANVSGRNVHFSYVNPASKYIKLAAYRVGTLRGYNYPIPDFNSFERGRTPASAYICLRDFCENVCKKKFNEESFNDMLLNDYYLKFAEVYA